MGQLKFYTRLYHFDTGWNNAPISKVYISHDSPVHKELGNLCFESVQFIKRELQALICDPVEI